VTGRRRSELIGTEFSDYFLESDSAKAGYMRAFQDGLIVNYPLKLVHKDGHVTPVLYNASVYHDGKGNVIGVIAVARDITERKIVEEELRKLLAELQRSNHDLQEFAYVASHDLQEPLRMISSYTQLLARKYMDKLDKDANEYIRFAVDGATRMQTLIGSLLTYSRVGRKPSHFDDVDCHSTLGIATVNLKAAILESNALIAADNLPVVRGDEVELTQLFQNLISNAIKFRGAKTPQIYISVKDEPSEWIFSVRDNGIGIDSQYHDKVFVIFQRLNPLQDYAGAGIGLAICKKIVERHGGKIWLDSEPGKGSTFSFSLPKFQQPGDRRDCDRNVRDPQAADGMVEEL